MSKCAFHDLDVNSMLLEKRKLGSFLKKMIKNYTQRNCDLNYIFYFLLSPNLNIKLKELMIGFNSPSITNLQFEIQSDSLTTEFIYTTHDSILD